VAEYKKILNTAREQADARLAPVGNSSFQSTPDEAGDSNLLRPSNRGLMAAKVPSVAFTGRTSIADEAEEDDFLTSYFNRLREQNKTTKAEVQKYLDDNVEEFPGDSTIPLDDPDLNTEGNIANIVKGFEGFKTKAYWDGDHWSIGYGTRAKDGDATITAEQAEVELNRSLSSAKASVIKHQKANGYDWSPNQVDALTSFTFNLGAGGLRNLTKKGTRGNETISEMILEYNTAGGNVLRGLTKRRKAEAKLFTQGYN
tara:strand:- start:913 stop:1683 length:771 start_codon:yes stop_codon:yes gene_type:complete